MRSLKLACLILLCAVQPLRADVLEKAAPEPIAKCGGYIGDVCGKEGWCDFPDDAACGIGKAGKVHGTCKLRPRICGRVYMPVCGCNGQTYGNACEAKGAGTDVLHTGKCLDAGGGR